MINNDKVVTSIEILVYEKIPVFRGIIVPLERSRVISLTNDQITYFANSIAGSTSALVVRNFFKEPIEKQFHFFGTFSATLVSILNSVVGVDPIKYNSVRNFKKKFFFTYCTKILE